MRVSTLLFGLLGLAQAGSSQSGLRHLQSSGSGSQTQVQKGEEEGADWGDISAVQVGSGEKASSGDPFESAGCCFQISDEGSDDKPCCLTREEKSWKDCFTNGHDPYHTQGPAFSITSGVVQPTNAVGGLVLDRGWSQTCPETAEEADAIIKADKVKAKPAAFTDDAATVLPVASNSSVEVGNYSGAFMDLLKKQVDKEIKQGLPWWGWCLVMGVLGVAISAEFVQVWREKHMRKKSHNLREDETEIARKIFATNKVSEDWRQQGSAEPVQAAAARSQAPTPARMAVTSTSGQYLANYQAAPAADPRVVMVPQAQQYYYQAQSPRSPQSPQYYMVSGSSVRPA